MDVCVGTALEAVGLHLRVLPQGYKGLGADGFSARLARISRVAAGWVGRFLGALTFQVCKALRGQIGSIIRLV